MVPLGRSVGRSVAGRGSGGRSGGAACASWCSIPVGRSVADGLRRTSAPVDVAGAGAVGRRRRPPSSRPDGSAGVARVEGWSDAISRLARRVRRKWRPHHSSRNRPAAMVSTRPTPGHGGRAHVELTAGDAQAVRRASVMVTSSLNAPEARACTGTSTRVGTRGSSRHVVHRPCRRGTRACRSDSVMRDLDRVVEPVVDGERDRDRRAR